MNPVLGCARVIAYCPAIMKNIVACLAAGALCASCIPITNLVRYDPAMDNAVVRPNHCVGSDTLEYKVGGAVFTAGIQQWPQTRDRFPVFRVFIKAPPGAAMEPGAATATVTSPHLQAPLQLQLSTTSNRWEVSLIQVPEGDVTIQLPGILVGGIHHEVPLMRFKHRRQMLTVLPANC